MMKLRKVATTTPQYTKYYYNMMRFFNESLKMTMYLMFFVINLFCLNRQSVITRCSRQVKEEKISKNANASILDIP